MKTAAPKPAGGVASPEAYVVTVAERKWLNAEFKHLLELKNGSLREFNDKLIQLWDKHRSIPKDVDRLFEAQNPNTKAPRSKLWASRIQTLTAPEEGSG